jgi:ribosomal protein L37AE/L43A
MWAVQAYPETVIEFRERFATEQACRDYVAALRWPDGFVCPECGAAKAWEMQRGLYWCRGCGYQVSVTAGTLFHDTHKELRLWFEAMWYVTNQKLGVSALGLQRVLGLGSYQIASLLKRWLVGTHQGAVQHSHLDYYLDEYTFQFNRRTSRSRGLLFGIRS